MTNKSMKRIHAVTLKRIVDAEYNATQDQPSNAIGIRADAQVLIPLREMHSQKCQELNDTRARYACECSNKDSLIQRITSGGLWGIVPASDGTDIDYLADIEREQLAELRGQLHAIGFSQRAITAAFRNVVRQ